MQFSTIFTVLATAVSFAAASPAARNAALDERQIAPPPNNPCPSDVGSCCRVAILDPTQEQRDFCLQCNVGDDCCYNQCTELYGGI